MTGIELQDKYICEKTLLIKDDELIPIIREIMTEQYILGLKQGKFNIDMYLMNKINKYETIISCLEKLIRINHDDININLYKKLIDIFQEKNEDL